MKNNFSFLIGCFIPLCPGIRSGMDQGIPIFRAKPCIIWRTRVKLSTSMLYGVPSRIKSFMTQTAARGICRNRRWRRVSPPICCHALFKTESEYSPAGIRKPAAQAFIMTMRPKLSISRLTADQSHYMHSGWVLRRRRGTMQCRCYGCCRRALQFFCALLCWCASPVITVLSRCVFWRGILSNPQVTRFKGIGECFFQTLF